MAKTPTAVSTSLRNERYVPNTYNKNFEQAQVNVQLVLTV